MSILFRQELEDFAHRKITFEQVSKRMKRKLVEKSLDRCMDILNEGAINLRNDIILSMRNSPPTGKLYTRTSKKGHVVRHRASSPGNPPRPDTGALIRSIGIDTHPDYIEVGSRITKPNYPLFLEQGTPKMEARPWLEPAFKKEEPKLKRRLVMVLQRAAADFARGT